MVWLASLWPSPYLPHSRVALSVQPTGTAPGYPQAEPKHSLGKWMPAMDQNSIRYCTSIKRCRYPQDRRLSLSPVPA